MKNNQFAVAVHILSLLQLSPGASSEWIATSVNTNAVVIRRISSKLKKAGFIQARAGVTGFRLAKEPTDITLLDIYKAIYADEQTLSIHEGANPNCVVGANIQRALTSSFHAAQQALEAQLASETLAQLTENLLQP